MKKVISGWFLCFVFFPVFAQYGFDQQHVRTATQKFIHSLSTAQQMVCVRPWADTNRLRWSNLPLGQHHRDGLRLDQMDDPQRILVHELLRTILSEQGYLKALFIMQYDEDTRNRLTSARLPIADWYGQEKYFTWIFGRPDNQEKWGLKFEGHHLSINMTFSTRGVSCTPLFTGINPGLSIKGITAGKYVMYQENEAGKNLFLSLTSAQRLKAWVDTLPFTIDVRTQTGKEAHILDEKGLPWSELNDQQKLFVDQIIRAWADNFQPGINEEKRASLTRSFHQARLVWMGTSSVDQLHYYALISPEWVIEFTNRDQGLQHFHTLWRMMTEDFGAKL